MILGECGLRHPTYFTAAPGASDFNSSLSYSLAYPWSSTISAGSGRNGLWVM